MNNFGPCTQDCPNRKAGCSASCEAWNAVKGERLKSYGRRAARAMGYHKLITYILDTEPGTSLKAAGWKCVGQAGGLRWTGKRRPEVDLCPAQMKIRFEREEGEKA